MQLDDHQRFAEVDSADALGDVEATAAQWRTGLALWDSPLDLAGCDAVVVAGMGGSGIAGDVLWALSLHDSPLPVVVHKGYDVPAFVGPRTVVVACSYSGSTEETLSAFTMAGKRGARRFAVTSGGALAELCDQEHVPVARVPAGRQPRHSLGLLVAPIMTALGRRDDAADAAAELESVSAALGRTVPLADNPAKQLAQRLARGAVALTWGGHGIGSVAAYRLKCQLNENAKLPAVHAELPEADHNEVVGWEHESVLSGVSGLVALRDPAGEHERVARRFANTTGLLTERLAWTADVVATGSTPAARIASLLLQADLISVYAAIAADRDPTPVRSIDRLKGQLG